jgi:predicted transcriptional regulator
MTRTVVHCKPNDVLQNVWSIMKDRGLKNLPVLDQDLRPIGVLNVSVRPLSWESDVDPFASA